MKNVCVMPLASPSVSISHLERCVWSIEAQDSVEFDHDIVVVVNSLDDEYTSHAINQPYFTRGQPFHYISTFFHALNATNACKPE